MAAQYLDPYETGGVHGLGGKVLLNPKDIPLNQYEQLSNRVLAKLKARPDIVIGPVKTKKGVVGGALATIVSLSMLAVCACAAPPGQATILDLPPILTENPPAFRLLRSQPLRRATPPAAGPGEK